MTLGKAPRPSIVKQDKGKAKAKPSDSKVEAEKVMYDYYESSLHDSTLKTSLLLAYEMFKVDVCMHRRLRDTLNLSFRSLMVRSTAF